MKDYIVLLEENDALQKRPRGLKRKAIESRDMDQAGKKVESEGPQVARSAGQTPPEQAHEKAARRKLLNFDAIYRDVRELIANPQLSEEDKALIKASVESGDKELVMTTKTILRNRFDQEIDQLANNPDYNSQLIRMMALELQSQKSGSIQKGQLDSETAALYDEMTDVLNKKADDLQKNELLNEEMLKIDAGGIVSSNQAAASSKNDSEEGPNNRHENQDLPEPLRAFIKAKNCPPDFVPQGWAEKVEYDMCVMLKGGTYSDGTTESEGGNKVLLAGMLRVYNRLLDQYNFPLVGMEQYQDIRTSTTPEKDYEEWVKALKTAWMKANDNFKSTDRNTIFRPLVFPRSFSSFSLLANFVVVQLYQFYHEMKSFSRE